MSNFNDESSPIPFSVLDDEEEIKFIGSFVAIGEGADPMHISCSPMSQLALTSSQATALNTHHPQPSEALHPRPSGHRKVGKAKALEIQSRGGCTRSASASSTTPWIRMRRTEMKSWTFTDPSSLDWIRGFVNMQTTSIKGTIATYNQDVVENRNRADHNGSRKLVAGIAQEIELVQQGDVCCAYANSDKVLILKHGQR
ncbi:hypothetical protein OF83DRAFT_1084991 [Amylostereum chailletii]|nr:hypothetical protein OF83DRAFT_1084991 [Amylostereum chailletii]